MKYMRKTPVEAIQWTGDNQREVYDFMNKTARTCCNMDDGFGNLIMFWKDFARRRFKAVIPKFGWVVREGNTFQFYKDDTFRKTFGAVADDCKAIDWKSVKAITEAFCGFGVEPSKKASGVLSTMVRLNNKGRMAKLIYDFYIKDEKKRREIMKQLSEGFKEKAGGKTKCTESDTFESVLDEMKELHAKKDKDYNESFHNLFKEYGMSYALAHIEEKLNRVKAIIANGGNAVKNEHIEDSLIDGACYNILTLIELRNGKH